MKLSELVTKLDRYFQVKDFGPDPPPDFLKVYKKVDYDYKKVFEKEFCQISNGLMLKGSDEVKEVFLITFPTPQVLREILEERTNNTLIFTHHPIDSETGGRGFLPIDLKLLDRLINENISIYSLHAPLDCHKEIGTNEAIVRAFRVNVLKDFVPYGGGFAGRIGDIKMISFKKFVHKVKEIFGVNRVEVGGAKVEAVCKLGIVAGGGDEVKEMKVAQDEGCDVYLTGEWHTRVRPEDCEGRKWAVSNDRACYEFSKNTQMALIAVSHAASEFLVMRTQMVEWFRKQGLKVEAIEQEDWWR